nr:hypothetical protein [Tanacetum cinerariifolium]
LTNLPEIFNDTYETPCNTKKVFSNMAGKSVYVSRNVTPLLDTMLVQHQAPKGEGGYTPGSDEGRSTLAKLMETYTILSNRSQLKQKRSRAVIHSLDEEGPSVHIEDSPKQGRIIEEMDKDENINLVSDQREVQETAEYSRDDDETLAETLLNIKRSSTKDKKKGIMQETELPKKLKKKEMI